MMLPPKATLVLAALTAFVSMVLQGCTATEGWYATNITMLVFGILSLLLACFLCINACLFCIAELVQDVEFGHNESHRRSGDWSVQVNLLAGLCVAVLSISLWVVYGVRTSGREAVFQVGLLGLWVRVVHEDEPPQK